VPAALAGEWVAPAPGDALVYRLKSDDNEETYGLSLVPGGMQARYDAYPMAVERAKRFAQYAATDLRDTEDELTFVLVDSFRQPSPRTSDDPAPA
jgi:hypothetical protein